MSKKALLVLSGGQDSTTCLFWLQAQGYEIHTVTFDYGQRHKRELESAMLIAGMAGVEPYNSEVIKLGDGILQGTSPLVSDNKLEQYENHQSLPGGLEKTFVPMRNQLFLTVAANRAFCKGIDTLVTGVCQEDFGGYPDCRAVFIDALNLACTLGTFTGEDGAIGPLKILTPLMYMSKAEAVRMAWDMTQNGLNCYGALAYSHTSYDGQYPPTGRDHATLLRAKGFEEADIPDPLILRAWRDHDLEHLPDAPNYVGPMEEFLAHIP